MSIEENGFEKIKSRVTPETKRFIAHGYDIRMQVAELLSKHPKIKTQKQLAEALGKSASEISKWLSGLHNITLESITKMEAVFDADIIMTDIKAKEKYQRKSLESISWNIEDISQVTNKSLYEKSLTLKGNLISRHNAKPTNKKSRTSRKSARITQLSNALNLEFGKIGETSSSKESLLLTEQKPLTCEA